MDGSAFVKGFKNIRNGVIRTAERASVEVRKAVGISNISLPESFPEYDHLSAEFKTQTKNLDTLHHDALSAYEAIQRSTGTAYTLAAKLRDSLSSNSTRAPYLAADALVNVQASIVDEVLPRVERRVKKRVIDPTKQELTKARQINHHMDERKRCYIDAARYHERVSDPSASQEDIRKAQDKMAELTQRTNELVSTMSDAIKRRSALIESVVAETIEFQRRFYVDSARCMERAIDVIGAEKLATMRGGADDLPERRSSVNVPSPQPEPSQSTTQPPPRRSTTVPVHSNSIWNELDDDDDDDDDDDIYNQERPKSSVYTDNIFDDPPPSQPEPESSRRSEPGSASDSSTGVANPFGRERAGSSYPSNGVGKRESSYPSGGVGQKESVSSYPTGGSRTRDKYPSSRTRAAAKPPPGPTSSFAPSSSRESNPEKPKPTRPVEPEADLLGFDTPTPPKPVRSRRSPSPPSSTNTEDLLDLGGMPDTTSSQRSSMRRSASSTAVEGDLLGDLGAAPQPRPRSSTQSRTRRSGAPQQSFSAPTMNTTPKPTAKPSPSSSISKEEELLQREELKKKHEREIKARADEKLAAVRERERADAKEREDKDNARSAAERKINSWTGNGTRRGNLRALLASLDTVLYPTATWKPVSMDVLKENSKVKVNYHKAILQVHPDKISSKNLSPDHLVLAELVFDELKNGYEVWTAECEGRPPPPGSVGPRNVQNQTPGFGGMSGMSGMYNNMGRTGMGGMGRGGMGGMGMGGMGNMGRGNMGMGNMGRSGMGFMGSGMGGMGMGGMGMGGRGMNGMGGMGGMGRRGGMSGMSQNYGRGMNPKR